jgi:hypothetical protein
VLASSAALGLLPEPIPADIAIPPWPKFLRGCLKYRESLDRDLRTRASPMCNIARTDQRIGSRAKKKPY